MGVARSRSHQDDYSYTLTVADVCKVLTNHPNGAPLVKSGDVLLFRGTTRSSKLIEWFTWCAYSHIGIVLMYNGQLCLLESVGHIDGPKCELHNRQKDGVRLVRLEDRLNAYLDETGVDRANATLQICWISLHFHQHSPPHHAYEQLLHDFARHSVGLGYQHSMQNLIHAELNFIPTETISSYTSLSADSTKKEYQCAELVAAALRHMRVLRLNFPCADVTPKSFINGSILDSDYTNPRVVLHQVQYHITVRADPSPQLYIASGETFGRAEDSL